jgi:hypothetical protein
MTNDLEYYGDIHRITAADGLDLVLDGPVRIRAFSDYGAPPTQFVTTRGYGQDGAREIDHFLMPRMVTLSVYIAGVANRQKYWDQRARLLDLLRPNRRGQLTITVILPNGETRSLTGRADPGPTYSAGATDGAHWNLDETIAFIAFDPLWAGDTVTVQMSEGLVTDDQLIFPIEFAIWFGGDEENVMSTGDLDYIGTWKSYPTLTVTGPYSVLLLVNRMTGAEIVFDQPLVGGDQRIVILTPGQQAVLDGTGTLNRFGEIRPDSNLTDFYIDAEPLAVDALPEIQAFFTDGSPESAVLVEYQPKFFGI